MSLERYRWERPIILSPRASAFEAARAMESNHVGAVVVQEHGTLLGIVTDRDLALRVIGFELDPNEAELQDIMTPSPAWLSIDDSEEDALSLMTERHVRRIPIVEKGKPVGMVTLDDLVLQQSVPSELLAQVVREQLAEPTSRKPYGVTHPTRTGRPSFQTKAAAVIRHDVRAKQTLRQFTRRLELATGIDNPERALTAFEVVASAIIRRLTPEEAKDFVSQLPSALHERLLALPAGPDRDIDRATIENELATRLNLDRDFANGLAMRIGASLGAVISSGELGHIAAQLPRDLKRLLIHS